MLVNSWYLDTKKRSLSSLAFAPEGCYHIRENFQENGMSYKIPMVVSEVRLVYESRVKPEERPLVVDSMDAYWIFESNWSDQMALLEEFNMLMLDRSYRAMALAPMSKGGINATVVDLRLAFAMALKARASSIVIAHNHPSGNLQPSQADIDITNRFKEAGELLSIPVMDHLILAPQGQYYSFADGHMLSD